MVHFSSFFLCSYVPLVTAKYVCIVGAFYWCKLSKQDVEHWKGQSKFLHSLLCTFDFGAQLHFLSHLRTHPPFCEATMPFVQHLKSCQNGLKHFRHFR
uniref:Secreted protein n=1 Tax=Engystomops pustulosus TaxID=76066 RepID=A0AAV6Z341_ENGPU|nr:hypothetical protein GDO81_018493 [Engystomops pustulosus]